MKRYKIKEVTEYGYFIAKERVLFMWFALSFCPHYEPKAEMNIYVPIHFKTSYDAMKQIQDFEKSRKNHRIYSVNGRIYVPKYT